MKNGIIEWSRVDSDQSQFVLLLYIINSPIPSFPATTMDTAALWRPSKNVMVRLATLCLAD